MKYQLPNDDQPQPLGSFEWFCLGAGTAFISIIIWCLTHPI